MVHVVLKRRPSAKNPNYCDVCETFVRTHSGGRRGRGLGAVRRRARFDGACGTDAPGGVQQADEPLLRPREPCRDRQRRVVDKLVGDEVVALYAPAVAPTTARKAVEAAGDLLRATAVSPRARLVRSGRTGSPRRVATSGVRESRGVRPLPGGAAGAACDPVRRLRGTLAHPPPHFPPVDLALPALPTRRPHNFAARSHFEAEVRRCCALRQACKTDGRRSARQVSNPTRARTKKRSPSSATIRSP